MRMTSALAVGIPSGGFRAGIPTPRPAADPLPRGTALKGRFARSLGPLRFRKREKERERERERERE